MALTWGGGRIVTSSYMKTCTPFRAVVCLYAKFQGETGTRPGVLLVTQTTLPFWEGGCSLRIVQGETGTRPSVPDKKMMYYQINEVLLVVSKKGDTF